MQTSDTKQPGEGWIERFAKFTFEHDDHLKEVDTSWDSLYSMGRIESFIRTVRKKAQEEIVRDALTQLSMMGADAGNDEAWYSALAQAKRSILTIASSHGLDLTKDPSDVTK